MSGVKSASAIYLRRMIPHFPFQIPYLHPNSSLSMLRRKNLTSLGTPSQLYKPMASPPSAIEVAEEAEAIAPTPDEYPGNDEGQDRRIVENITVRRDDVVQPRHQFVENITVHRDDVVVIDDGT